MKTKHLPLKIIALVAIAAFPFSMLLAQDYNYYPPAGYNVYIYDNYYSPQYLTIPGGTTVTWYNMGSMNHTVTFNSGINSGTITPGSSFSWTFSTSGTYNYYCQFHSGMTGSIYVTSGGGGSSGSTGSLTGTVTSGGGGGSGQIYINSISRTKTTGSADGTFQNGWQWIFDVSVPWNETNVSMRFNNWLMQGGNAIIPSANNVRLYSAQSSNANSQSNAVYISQPSAYSSPLMLTGNLGGAPSGMRRITITVETRIPVGSQMGTYSTDFGIRSLSY
jgi:plastocyanin